MEPDIWDLILLGRGSATRYYLTTLDRSLFPNIVVIGKKDAWGASGAATWPIRRVLSISSTKLRTCSRTWTLRSRPLAELRRRTIEKSLNPFRISLGNRRVYTTFAIELKTLR